jgi:choline dehydrogenase
LEWDYIIVGGGTAGCVLANRLTQRRGTKVLLLEAGGPFSRLRNSVPLPSMRLKTRFSWDYFTLPQKHLAHRRLSLPLGQLLGGSSSVNAMMYSRGNSRDYDVWEKLGNRGWSYSEALRYYRKAEDQERGSSPHHGVGGPLAISDPRHRAPFSEAFVEACRELGIPANDNFNSATQDGAGFFQLAQKRGSRVSTATAYLRPARQRSELTVITKALVTKLVLNGRRATGVEYHNGGERVRVDAAREVIVCGGAVNSPKILMLSGIGPADHVSSMGITLVADVPGVGHNLQDHVRIPVLYESPRSSPGDRIHWVPAGLNYLFLRRGVMVSNCCESGAFVRSSPELDAPDLLFVTHFQSPLHPRAVDLEFCLMASQSRGRVRLGSADPEVAPEIDPNYLSTESEVQVLLRGLRLARRIARSKALRDFPLGNEILPGAALTSDRDLACYLRENAETCYHPSGTCKMGHDPMAVVDDRLRVHGVEGLRVVDASVIPKLISGGTFAPTVMIAEKAADLITSDSS